MKQIILIVVSVLAIFCLLYFSTPPKFIHYLLSFVLGLNILRSIMQLVKQKNNS